MPLRQIATLSTGMRAEKILRRNQFRTITVGAFPREGKLASEVMMASQPDLDRFRASLPPGFKLEIAGEVHPLRPGTFVHYSSHQEHALRVTSDEPLETAPVPTAPRDPERHQQDDEHHRRRDGRDR